MIQCYTQKGLVIASVLVIIFSTTISFVSASESITKPTSYVLTTQDEAITDRAVVKLEAIIKQRGEYSRTLIIAQLQKLYDGQKDSNDRISMLISRVILALTANSLDQITLSEMTTTPEKKTNAVEDILKNGANALDELSLTDIQTIAFDKDSVERLAPVRDLLAGKTFSQCITRKDNNGPFADCSITAGTIYLKAMYFGAAIFSTNAASESDRSYGKDSMSSIESVLNALSAGKIVSQSVLSYVHTKDGTFPRFNILVSLNSNKRIIFRIEVGSTETSRIDELIQDGSDALAKFSVADLKALATDPISAKQIVSIQSDLNVQTLSPCDSGNETGGFTQTCPSQDAATYLKYLYLYSLLIGNSFAKTDTDRSELTKSLSSTETAINDITLGNLSGTPVTSIAYRNNGTILKKLYFLVTWKEADGKTPSYDEIVFHFKDVIPSSNIR